MREVFNTPPYGRGCPPPISTARQALPCSVLLLLARAPLRQPEVCDQLASVAVSKGRGSRNGEGNAGAALCTPTSTSFKQDCSDSICLILWASVSDFIYQFSNPESHISRSASLTSGFSPWLSAACPPASLPQRREPVAWSQGQENQGLS